MTKGDEIASFVIQRRGYLVVGIHPGSTIAIGEKLYDWAHLPLSQPIVIVAETTQEDWREQGRIVMPWKDDPEVPKAQEPTGGTFFKAITD